MTRIYALLFAVALTLNACATAGPIAVKCGLQDVAIAAADYAQIAADIHAKNWDDLAKEGEKLGWAVLDCVLGDQVAQNPGVKANVDEFKRLKSVEFRSAGVSACRSQREYDTTMCLGGAANPLQTDDPRLPAGKIRTGFGVCPAGYHPLTPYADGFSCVPNAVPVDGFALNPPPCYLPGVTKLRSRPATCTEVTRDGASGVVASDGRFIPIDRSEPAWLTAWKNPAMPDKRVPPLTVYEADGCPDGWVNDGVVYATSPPVLDCYPIKKPDAAR